MIIDSIRDLLKDPRLEGIDPDGEERIRVHNEILCQKKMMKEVFEEFYSLYIKLADRYFCHQGEELEIGSGVSFFKKIRPHLITSDIVFAPHLDMIVDAQKMDKIKTSSIRAVYASNVFHHLTEPQQFFLELVRVLKPGGGCILIEPYYGVVARNFYSHVHTTEAFNCSQKQWNTAEKMGIMSNANQALSYIVFVRDRKLFEKKNQNLKLICSYPLQNYLRYFFSGGINFKAAFTKCFSTTIKSS